MLQIRVFSSSFPLCLLLKHVMIPSYPVCGATIARTEVPNPFFFFFFFKKAKKGPSPSDAACFAFIFHFQRTPFRPLHPNHPLPLALPTSASASTALSWDGRTRGGLYSSCPVLVSSATPRPRPLALHTRSSPAAATEEERREGVPSVLSRRTLLPSCGATPQTNPPKAVVWVRHQISRNSGCVGALSGFDQAFRRRCCCRSLA